MPQGSKVAVIGPSLGSILHFRAYLLSALAERGHQVTAYAPPATPPEMERLPAGVGFQQIPLDRIGSNPVRDAGTLRALLELWRKARPDVVLNCTLKPAIYGSLAARWTGARRIFSLITGRGAAFSGSDQMRRQLVERAARFLCRRSLASNRLVFFQNPDDRDFFCDIGLVRNAAQTFLVNGSGVDLQFFQPVALPREPSFVLIARLLSEKGIREYVEAARRLRALYPEASFRLAGGFDGAWRSIPEREVQSWVAEGVIEYLGRVNDVRPAIASSSVFVLPSYYPEGQPRTILEAMAMGRPIITADSPGCRETVEHGRNGFLVPVRNVGALVRRMEEFIEQPEQVHVMGRESRAIAEAKYNVHDVNRVIMDAMDLS